MATEKSMLMKMCTEDVYRDNIFCLLDLKTTATTRQIRRRREDLDSAQMLGDDAWKNEFRHLKGRRSIPTAEEIAAVFKKVEDPEQRIISEFFWMWPLDDHDCTVDEFMRGDVAAAVEQWEQVFRTECLGKRLIAQHNLAVCHQCNALVAEFQVYHYEGEVPADHYRQLLSYWENAFTYWDELADNDDFWGLYEARMRELDDPRLTGGFIRRFRAEFPVAFNNINAQLAVRYAKAARHDDAKRHVGYMNRAMSGHNHLQENMNIIFTPMEQRVNMLVFAYDKKVNENPKQGLEYANKLLSNTDETRRIAQCLLKDGQRIRVGIFTPIAAACNRYQVQYGDATKDWQGCLTILEKLKLWDITDDLKRLVEKNAEVVEENLIQTWVERAHARAEKAPSPKPRPPPQPSRESGIRGKTAPAKWWVGVAWWAILLLLVICSPFLLYWGFAAPHLGVAWWATCWSLVLGIFYSVYKIRELS